MMRRLSVFCLFTAASVAFSVSVLPASAAERDADAAAAAAMGHSEDEVLTRPAKLADLTKGEPIPPPGDDGYPYWPMGPVGIIGLRNGVSYGDQIQVTSITPGSPADGKFMRGDVILAVQGQKLRHDVKGWDNDRMVGNAIIKAEEPAGKGLLEVSIWRDRNWIKRHGAKDVFAEDISKMIQEAESDNGVYEWKGDTERAEAVVQMGFDKYPIDAFYTNITVQLDVMGTYSDDSPWNCEVVKKVRDNALKIIAERHKPDVRGLSKRGGGWPGVLALVASGEKEYVDIARAWVQRLPKQGRGALVQDMNATPPFKDGGMQSWRHGFEKLEMAIYYDATGDKTVLPQLRYSAIQVALGQNGGGSWGHTFAHPKFNGGMLHKCNPGYGAMNNAGTRCFFFLALAQKAGIDHPEINAAIARSRKFFGTYIDRGCIPYGYHSPYPSDDSNGKNYGAAYAFYTLGDKYAGKYFSLGSAHASFTRRGGHGSPTLWYYTPLSCHISGPQVVQATMRNMRYFYTLSRRHDGSFIFYGSQSPGIGGKGMRDPTSTIVMHLSRPLEKLIITGKGADPKFYATDEEYDELLMSARNQIKEPVLLAKMGKPWKERSTKELFEYVNHWHPSRRRDLAAELGKRYQAGEKDIVSKLIPMLSSDDARMREGACWALGECGRDAVLPHMSKVVAMLKDDAEFVRMQAAKTIGKATDPGDKLRELEVMKCVVDDHPQMTGDQGNVKWAGRSVLLPRKKRGQEGPTTLLTTSPFQAGYDEDLVRRALERIVTADPQGTTPIGWDKEAMLKLAGPVTFSAEETQLNDAMFRGGRKSSAQALLLKHGYREAAEGNAFNVRERSYLPRHRRRGVGYKDAFITPKLVKQAPGNYRDFLDALRQWQHDSPTVVLEEKTGKGLPPITTPLHLLIAIIERDTDNKPLPSISPDVARMFLSELAAAGSTDAQIKLCRAELEDLERKNYFRKIHSMTYLAKKLGAKALDDICPFAGHQNWRLREHANKVLGSLIKAGAGPQVIEQFEAAQERPSGLLGNWNAAGIITALADAGHKPALPAAKAALKHHDTVVREAAVQAAFKIGGDAELTTVFAFMRQHARTYEDFNGCELALLSKRDDPKHVQKVSQAAITLLPRSEPMLRRSLAWLLCQYKGEKNLAAVHKEATTTTDDADLREMVLALAYSPDPGASKLMLDLVNRGKRIRDIVAPLSVHRMVGRNGFDEVSDKERVSFARGILNLTYNEGLVKCLGRTYSGPSIQLLYDVMKMKKAGDPVQGAKKTALAAQSLIECAEGIQNPSKLDSQIATEVLANVVEYIEVTHLRGGMKAHVESHRDAMPYMLWRDHQMRAGQALLKFHKPKKATIPTFDDTDLDI